MAEALALGAGELRRFIVERQPVRGFWLRLDGAWRELHSHQQYPAGVERLLGEAVGASVLLAATLKFQGTLTLQLQGNGLVKLLVAQCSHDFSVRAVARCDESIPEGASFGELIGDGRLTVTLEAEDGNTRYQGIVALQGGSLAQCLENYFLQSEQLPTRIALFPDAKRVTGVLMQKMPAPLSQGEAEAAVAQQVWESLQSQVDAIDAALLKLGSAEDVLPHLCGEYDCRLFSGTPVRFSCRCSQARVAGLLRALGADELRTIIEEQGEVTITCEFCGRPYRFDAIDVEQLLSDSASPGGPQTVN